MHTGHCTQDEEKLFDVEDYHVFQDMQHVIFRISLTMHILSHDSVLIHMIPCC